VADSPLKREFEWYLENQELLVKQYDGRFVAIKNCRVVGSYDDQLTAISETAKTEELGTFLVQKVEPGSGAYNQTFYSRAIFA